MINEATDPDPFQFAMAAQVGVTVIDNDDPGFYLSGTGSDFSFYADPTAYGGDVRYHVKGVGANWVDYEFTGLTPGQNYQIATTWTTGSSRTSYSEYEIYGLARTVDRPVGDAAGHGVGRPAQRAERFLLRRRGVGEPGPGAGARRDRPAEALVDHAHRPADRPGRQLGLCRRDASGTGLPAHGRGGGRRRPGRLPGDQVGPDAQPGDRPRSTGRGRGRNARRDDHQPGRAPAAVGRADRWRPAGTSTWMCPAKTIGWTACRSGWTRASRLRSPSVWTMWPASTAARCVFTTNDLSVPQFAIPVSAQVVDRLIMDESDGDGGITGDFPRVDRDTRAYNQDYRYSRKGTAATPCDGARSPGWSTARSTRCRPAGRRVRPRPPTPRSRSPAGRIRSRWVSTSGCRPTTSTTAGGGRR